MGAGEPQGTFNAAEADSHVHIGFRPNIFLPDSVLVYHGCILVPQCLHAYGGLTGQRLSKVQGNLTL